MILYNGAQEAIVVRPFSGGYMVDFDDMVIIPPGQRATVSCGDHSSPRLLSHPVLVRDWGPPQIVVEETLPMVLLRPDTSGIYKVSVHADKTICEGFLVTFLRLQERIRFWPTNTVTN
jgi:hypothetical protein